MYRGRIVELAAAKTFFAAPQHPYSRLLFGAMPGARRGGGDAPVRKSDEAQAAVTPMTGCAFHPRCPHAVDRCLEGEPPLRPIASDQMAACFRAPLPGNANGAGA